MKPLINIFLLLYLLSEALELETHKIYLRICSMLFMIFLGLTILHHYYYSDRNKLFLVEGLIYVSMSITISIILIKNKNSENNVCKCETKTNDK